MDEYYLLTFETITHVMEAETQLKKYGASLVALPGEISAGCGFALRLPRPLPPDIRANHTVQYKVTGRGKTRCIKVYDDSI